MKYTIIIAVYNRLGEVKELLESAEKLDFNQEAFELLFVDDGSTDGFKAFIESYQSDSNLNTRAIYQQNQGPGVARNTGMENSDSEYFIFVDSDCLFPPQWLQEIENYLQKEPLDAFGGPDAAHESFSDVQKAINYSMTSFLGTGGTRGSKKSVAKFYPRSFNMGIKQVVYEKIGGMSKLRHGQDMDFSQRIYQAGFKVGLVEKAFVYHKRRTDLKKFFRQIFNWGVARINLGFAYKEMLKPIHFLPAMVLVGYFLTGVLVLFIPKFSYLFLIALGTHLLVCVFAFLQSFSQYKKLKVAFLSIFTLNIQVFAYGMGLIYALFHKLISKQEATGFVKNYYGKKK